MKARVQRTRFLVPVIGALLAPLMYGCGRSASPPAEGPEPDAVAVGYGTQSKEDITGSVASLSTRQLEGQRASRVEDLLQGRVAGLQVMRLANGNLSVRIRGTSSFYGSNEPLFVIDGVPIPMGSSGSALTGIAPQDVARIDVLKDAGATAIYGSRGANGVVLITTKRRR